jgi:trehalose 6-phosphate phosphatase
MKYLLSKESLPVAARLAREQTLCAFDFDGTLARIVRRPDQAAMRARTRDLLYRLAKLYPCIVVSGRARQDVMEKLRGVPVAQVIGNHGADTEETLNARSLIERWKAVLEARLGCIPGLWIEDKGLSLALHYRQCTQKAGVRRLIIAATGPLKQSHSFGGKQVINVVVAGSHNKGDALAAERERLHCNWVLYAGDDENDESAFAMGGNIVSVRIGRKQSSRAHYYLRTQAEIDALLDLLVRLREHGACIPGVLRSRS